MSAILNRINFGNSEFRRDIKFENPKQFAESGVLVPTNTFSPSLQNNSPNPNRVTIQDTYFHVLTSPQIVYQVSPKNGATNMDILLKYQHLSPQAHETLNCVYDPNVPITSCSTDSMPVLSKENRNYYHMSLYHSAVEFYFDKTASAKFRGHDISELAPMLSLVFGGFTLWEVYVAFKSSETVKINNLVSMLELTWNEHRGMHSGFNKEVCTEYVKILCRDLRDPTYLLQALASYNHADGMFYTEFAKNIVFC